MLKIVILAILCGIIIIYLKAINSEIFTLAIIASGIILVYYGLNYISNTFLLVSQLIDKIGTDNQLYSIVFKVSAIGYIIEFGAGTIEDMGLKSLADKLVFAGKAFIVSMALPIIYSILNLLNSLIL